MPRYFFDIHSNGFQRDQEGVECDDVEAARIEAMRSLPEIGMWAIPNDGDNQAFTVMVRDETNTIVYTATLTFAGLRLNEQPPTIRSVG